MTTVNVTHFGMSGTGATLRAAKLDATVKLESFIGDTRKSPPTIIAVDCCAALVYRSPDSWVTGLITEGANGTTTVRTGRSMGRQRLRIAPRSRCKTPSRTSCSSHGRSKDRPNSDITWTTERSSKYLKGSELKSTVSDFLRWAAWQRKYALARYNGASDETAREFAGGLRKSIIRYADETETDIPLRDWMKNRFGDPDCIVVASHVDRDRATVPEGDLVNTQVTLPDGRLARTAHSSQRFVADGSGGHLEMHTIHIFVERPRASTVPA